MSSISIIGLGNMASALADRSLAGGNAVEIIGRDQAKAKALAAALGGSTVGTAGTAPAWDIVILAVPYASAATVVSEYGTPCKARSSSTSPTPSPPISLASSPPTAVRARRRSPRPPPSARMS
jgi:3-hydroxyisobutyrate dehydrogenase-like beta-hydroxyacid dehydrogenase